MSKIEEALKKARENRSKQLVPSGQVSSVEGQSASPKSGRELLDIESKIDSSRRIATMREQGEMPQKQLALKKIIYPDMQENHIANSFRELRTKILQKSNGRQRTIMVTSPTSGCGCSFSALNLAAAFSFDESKTALLVDCNLRNSGLSKILSSEGHGLTDYLESTELDVSEIIHPTGIKRLRLVPAGGVREVPVEYFTSMKMRSLLSAIEERYPDRYIIIDTPPILESADSHILSELCDFVLLVVPYGKFTQSQIKAAADAISGEKLIGIIFNNEPCVPGQSWRRFLKSLFSPSGFKWTGLKKAV
ncbi:MAG: polysaccharide biosynthesis protein [Gammaproteobacteria bacterium]|nr:polysaccharide biosynthesis protein [Gammaproteobacteria bacterium]